MADYISSCRTNYFKIKKNKEEEFGRFCASISVEPGTKLFGRTKRFMFMSEDHGIPSLHVTDDWMVEGPEIDWAKELAPLLVEGEVVHFVENGFEKMRYLSGLAMRLRSDGKIFWNNINDVPLAVRKFARKHGSIITDNCY